MTWTAGFVAKYRPRAAWPVSSAGTVDGKLFGKSSQRFPDGARFLTEARLVSMIQHPGVVYTFEFGQLPDQTAYIIMEYLQGESLAKRLKASGGRLGSSAVNVGR